MELVLGWKACIDDDTVDAQALRETTNSLSSACNWKAAAVRLVEVGAVGLGAGLSGRPVCGVGTMLVVVDGGGDDDDDDRICSHSEN